MDQQYFILEVAHSARGRVKRIKVSYKLLRYAALSVGLLTLVFFGAMSSYARMSSKVNRYDELRTQFDYLRTRYQDLQRVSKQRNEQMATLQILASEVSTAYGVNQRAAKPDPVTSSGSSKLIPTVHESIEEYNFLKEANFSGVFHRYAYQWQIHSMPSLWPVNGQLRSPFGGRHDPFSAEGEFHTGVDLSATSGTEVHVTADGVVQSAGWNTGYGKLVVVDHGNGIETYYAHLSQFLVVPGEEVRSGEVIALSGGTGRSTSPHLHYEVRLGGTPVNPYKYLAKSQLSAPNKPIHNDLGL